MSNYPPGAKEDSSAPYNQEDPNLSIYTYGDDSDSICVDSDNNKIVLDESDIYYHLFPAKYFEETFLSASRVKGGVNIKTKSGLEFVIDDEDIISYFYTKYD